MARENTNVVIPAGLRADIMRNEMESKNTLAAKGSLYVGTGASDTLGSQTVYGTKALNPGTVDYVLMSNGAGEQIAYKQIVAGSITDHAVTLSKLDKDCVKIGSGYYQLYQAARDIPGYDVDTQALSLVGLNEVKINNTAYSSLEVPIINTTTVEADGSLSAPIVTATNYFNSTSDARLKMDIQSYTCPNSILDLDIKSFKYKNTGNASIGCLAQDLQKICPEIVHEDINGFLSIEETKIVYLLLEEVKKLKQEIKEIKGR